MTVAHDERKSPNRPAVRRMEKWIVATSAAVALSAAFAGSLPVTSLLTPNSGDAKRFIIGFEEGVTPIRVQGAEIPATYWSELAQEVLTWPRLSVTSEEDPEPIL